MKKKSPDSSILILMVKYCHNYIIFTVIEFLLGSLQFIPHINILCPHRESTHNRTLFLPYLMSSMMCIQASLRPTVKGKKKKKMKKTVKR